MGASFRDEAPENRAFWQIGAAFWGCWELLARSGKNDAVARLTPPGKWAFWRAISQFAKHSVPGLPKGPKTGRFWQLEDCSAVSPSGNKNAPFWEMARAIIEALK